MKLVLYFAFAAGMSYIFFGLWLDVGRLDESVRAAASLMEPFLILIQTYDAVYNMKASDMV